MGDHLRHRRPWDLGLDPVIYRGRPNTLAAAAFNFTIDGVPLLFNGEEVANQTRGHDPHLEINGNAPNATTTQAFFKTLIGLRAAHPALRQGSLARVGNGDSAAVATYARSSRDEDFLIETNFSGAAQQTAVQASAGAWTEVNVTGNAPPRRPNRASRATTSPSSAARAEPPLHPVLAARDGSGFPAASALEAEGARPAIGRRRALERLISHRPMPRPSLAFGLVLLGAVCGGPAVARADEPPLEPLPPPPSEASPSAPAAPPAALPATTVVTAEPPSADEATGAPREGERDRDRDPVGPVLEIGAGAAFVGGLLLPNIGAASVLFVGSARAGYYLSEHVGFLAGVDAGVGSYVARCGARCLDAYWFRVPVAVEYAVSGRRRGLYVAGGPVFANALHVEAPGVASWWNGLSVRSPVEFGASAGVRFPMPFETGTRREPAQIGDVRLSFGAGRYTDVRVRTPEGAGAGPLERRATHVSVGVSFVYRLAL